MKKRLLMQLLALVCVMGAYAAKAGDFLYTSSAKYQVVSGENLIAADGSFAAGFGEFWKTETNEAPDGEQWSIETGLGPNGESVLKSKAAMSSEGHTLQFLIPISAGTYTFSYWIKAEGSGLTSTNNGSTNYVNYFLSEDGTTTVAKQIAGQSVFSTEWNQVVYAFTVESDAFLVFQTNAIATGTMMTGFEVMAVSEVFDTRITDRAIAYAEKLLAEPDLSKEQDDVKGTIDAIKLTIADESSIDAATVNDLLTGLNKAIEIFLAANAGTLVGTTVDGISTTRYLGDWAKIGSVNWNNLSSNGYWSFNGGRWGFAPNTEPEYDDDGNVTNSAGLERPLDDGNVASAGIQTSYTLDVGINVNPSVFKETSIKGGKFMFSIEAQAVAASNKAQPYGANEGVEIAGPWMWVGNDTIRLAEKDATTEVEHPTWKFAETTTALNNTNWQRLYYIGTIAEGEDITAGFHFPVLTNTGGRYSLRNPEFRLIGKTQEEIDHFYAYDMMKVQQNALKIRLDSATVLNALTKADNCPWGHKVLKDSIDKFTAIYNTSIAIIDADGNELQADKVTLEFKDELLDAVKMMNSAISEYRSNNKIFKNLKDNIDYCVETKNNELYAACDKATFQTAIDKAQGLVDATTEDADEMEKFTAAEVELLTARQDFMIPSGSHSNPIDLNFTLKNGCFQDFPSDNKTNYTESKTVHDWNLTCGTDIKQWQIRVDSARYESAKFLNAWRGTTVGPNGKAQQTLKLNKAGVYEYRAKAYAYDDTWSQYLGIAEVLSNLNLETFDTESCNDTIYRPNIRLFFGKNGATNDSLALYKVMPEVLGHGRSHPRTYSIIYVKNNDDEEEFELGFEAYENGASAGAAGFGFGDNHLYYLGAKDAYETALKAEFAAVCASARDSIAKYKNAEMKAGSEALKLGLINSSYRYMFDAASHPCEEKANLKIPATPTLQDYQNGIISIRENMALLSEIANYVAPEPDPTGIAAPAAVKKALAADGIYTITGVRIQGAKNSLPRGLYIINGKKVVIK